MSKRKHRPHRLAALAELLVPTGIAPECKQHQKGQHRNERSEIFHHATATESGVVNAVALRSAVRFSQPSR